MGYVKNSHTASIRLWRKCYLLPHLSVTACASGSTKGIGAFLPESDDCTDKPAQVPHIQLQPITGLNRYHWPQRAGQKNFSGLYRVAVTRPFLHQPATGVPRAAHALAGNAFGYWFVVVGQGGAQFCQGFGISRVVLLTNMKPPDDRLSATASNSERGPP